ncbi:MAG: Protein of unknown function (DUF2442) [Rhodobacteraceae bacterium HLUCCA08]|nr:MAG: Protein of unknown function (DUF2442) [Rhodobacteraceae bacterium HLUCCA08]
MWVGLADVRTIGVPLAWFPRILNTSEAARTAVQISPFGLHWETLDEDISVSALLADAPGRRRSRVSLAKAMQA